MRQEHYITHDRSEMIALCRKVSEFLRSYVKERPFPIIIDINGDYASGKSLVADSIKAGILGKNVEDPKWKHRDNQNTVLDDTPISVSFINMRMDFIEARYRSILKLREHAQGLFFISNRPSFSLSKLMSGVSLPSSDMSVSVKFPEGEKRPLKFGPLEIGHASKEIGNRELTFDYLTL